MFHVHFEIESFQECVILILHTELQVSVLGVIFLQILAHAIWDELVSKLSKEATKRIVLT